MSLKGQVLDGALLATYLQDLVKQVNEGGSINIEATYNSVFRARNL